MDYMKVVLALSFAYACLHFLIKSARSRRNPAAAPLPPGPPRRPITGNISQIRGGSPYQVMANLAKTYGPVMSLKLGSVTTVVFSTAEAAKEVLTKHDNVLANRAVRHVAKALDHHKSSVIWSQTTDNWRNLRKICTMQMFTSKRLDASEELRQRKVQQLREYLYEASRSGSAVDIGGAMFTTILNMISNTLFSVDLAHYGSDFSHEFEDMIFGTMETSAKPNVADFFPALQWVDPQGARKQAGIYCKKMMDIFDKIIEERLEERAGKSMEYNDVLEALLDLNLKKEYELSLNDLKHLFLDIFIAGIDTSSTTLEWATAELLNNPKKLEKAHAELQEVLGERGEIRESDISKLPYLQAVVKETLRLHPPGPLLLPHQAKATVEVCGFTVPKDAQVLVNVWAIGRDPKSWAEPSSFLPERFVGSAVDVRGRDFELLPFGAGRRLCPGLPLANRMLHMILGTFLVFEWELDGGMKPEEMGMNEKSGITLVKKAEPAQKGTLQATPHPFVHFLQKFQHFSSKWFSLQRENGRKNSEFTNPLSFSYRLSLPSTGQMKKAIFHLQFL